MSAPIVTITGTLEEVGKHGDWATVRLSPSRERVVIAAHHCERLREYIGRRVTIEIRAEAEG